MSKIPNKIINNPSFKDAIILYNNLPETLSEEEILKYNKSNINDKKDLIYTYQSFKFNIFPGVFFPSGASKIIFDYIFFNNSSLKNKNYLCMGCGAGIEAVLAKLKKANVIYAVDVDNLSIQSAKYNFNMVNDGQSDSKFYPIVSNLFNFITNDSNVKFDLMTFNPPAVSINISDNKDVIRNTCIGSKIVYDFFSQIKRKHLLSPKGKILVVLSNTSKLKEIIRNAIILGFIPKILNCNKYKNLIMYLFEFSLNKVDK